MKNVLTFAAIAGIAFTAQAADPSFFNPSLVNNERINSSAHYYDDAILRAARQMKITTGNSPLGGLNGIENPSESHASEMSATGISTHPGRPGGESGERT